jgi:hypothetical protein
MADGEDGTVTITSPIGRAVYADGNYLQPLPEAIRCTVLAEFGPTIFETVTPEGYVDYRGTANIAPENPDVTLALEPVVPPEKCR